LLGFLIPVRIRKTTNSGVAFYLTEEMPAIISEDICVTSNAKLYQVEECRIRCRVFRMHPALLPPTIYFWFIPLILIDLVLKGMALWHSSRRKQFWWFIALLVVNSVGILPLLYLLIYGVQSKKRK